MAKGALLPVNMSVSIIGSVVCGRCEFVRFFASFVCEYFKILSASLSGEKKFIVKLCLFHLLWFAALDMTFFTDPICLGRVFKCFFFACVNEVFTNSIDLMRDY